MCRPLLHRAPVNPACQEANETVTVAARVAVGRAAILALAKVATVLLQAATAPRLRTVSHSVLEGKPNANHVRARIRTHVHSDYINDSS
jgi:hypothetical protein